MEDLVELVTGGHVTATKIVLTAVVTALAVYQALLAVVVYGRARLPFLSSSSAAVTHRTVGDVIVALVLLVGFMCLVVHGFEDSVRAGAPGPDGRAGWHSALSTALVVVLALKLAVLHIWRSLGRLLPVLGVGVLTLMIATWLTSAGAFLLRGST